MHRLKHIICLLIPTLLLLGACDGGQEKERSVSFFAMDTYMSLRIYGGPEELPETRKDTLNIDRVVLGRMSSQSAENYSVYGSF